MNGGEQDGERALELVLDQLDSQGGVYFIQLDADWPWAAVDALRKGIKQFCATNSTPYYFLVSPGPLAITKLSMAECHQLVLALQEQMLTLSAASEEHDGPPEDPGLRAATEP